MPTQEHMPLLGKTSSRMALLCNFYATTDHWREMLCFVFLRHHALVHWSMSTIAQSGKGHSNYTHNKSVFIKTFENLIVKMFQQKREILTPRNLHPYGMPRLYTWSFWSHSQTTLFILHPFCNNYSTWLNCPVYLPLVYSWKLSLSQG